MMAAVAPIASLVSADTTARLDRPVTPPMHVLSFRAFVAAHS
jgi:hypothetical protein